MGNTIIPEASALNKPIKFIIGTTIGSIYSTMIIGSKPIFQIVAKYNPLLQPLLIGFYILSTGIVASGILSVIQQSTHETMIFLLAALSSTIENLKQFLTCLFPDESIFHNFKIESRALQNLNILSEKLGLPRSTFSNLYEQFMKQKRHEAISMTELVSQPNLEYLEKLKSAHPEVYETDYLKLELQEQVNANLDNLQEALQKNVEIPESLRTTQVISEEKVKAIQND